MKKKLNETSSHPNEELENEVFWLSGMGLVTLLVAVTIIWIACGLIAYNLPDTLEESGQSGDMFGGVTALFSGLAFAGLIFTLFVQKKELQFQREELSHLVEEQRQTKEHLKDQATHLKSQSEFIERQIFESSFFQLLNSFSSYRSSFQFGESSGSYALAVVANKLSAKQTGLDRKKRDRGSVNLIQFYEAHYADHSNSLGPYFRLLYNLIKFIDHSEINNKKFYTNLVRAQLGSAELTLLALNCASKLGDKKMAPLVKNYELLKHFDNFEIFENEDYSSHLYDFYADWMFYEAHQVL